MRDKIEFTVESVDNGYILSYDRYLVGKSRTKTYYKYSGELAKEIQKEIEKEL